MPSQKMILITGGSGFIGTKLSERLLDLGYTVLVVDTHAPRIKHAQLSFINLDLTKESIPMEYEGKVYGIVHLAGKNIFGRWTNVFKKELYDSRIESARSLCHTISSWKEKPLVLVSASAFGYYGNKGDVLVREDTPVGNDFGASLCYDWEKEVQKIREHGVRTVSIRSANVLGSGGFLSPLLTFFRLKMGFYLGKGEGWFPWIHIDDIVSLYIFALENEAVSGPLNAAAPEFVTQKEFLTTLSRLFNTWTLISLPIPIFSLYLGEFALSFNNSVKMSPEKATSLGFTFTYSEVKEALESVVK